MLGWAAGLSRDARAADEEREVKPRRRVLMHNQQHGIVSSVDRQSRSAHVALADGTTVLLPKSGLEIVPTPSLGLIVSGAETTSGREFVSHVLQERERVLLELGAYLAVVGLCYKNGSAVVHGGRLTCEERLACFPSYPPIRTSPWNETFDNPGQVIHPI